MDRAARRRAMRANGYHRAEGKAGRRTGTRSVSRAEPDLQALERAGFVVAKPELVLPKGRG